MASEVDLALAAGLFMGEGCISLAPAGRSSTGPKYRLSVRIGMCDKEVVHWLGERFAGSVNDVPPRRTNCREAWVWQVAARQAASFLVSIWPYLFGEKLPQAELGMEFQSRRRRGRRLSVSEREWDVAACRQMSELKRRAVGVGA